MPIVCSLFKVGRLVTPVLYFHYHTQAGDASIDNQRNLLLMRALNGGHLSNADLLKVSMP